MYVETETELRRLRKSLGLSQEAMARRLGVSLGGYGAWDRGYTPTPRQTLLLVRLWAREPGLIEAPGDLAPAS